jgi:CBS domain-containing protein
MWIGDHCTRRVVCIEAAEMASEAIRLMRDFQVGSVVVVQTRGPFRSPVGIITDRDIALCFAEGALDLAATPVRALMTQAPVCIEEREGLDRAVEAMRANAVRRLPVVDADGSLVGIITADDIIRLYGAHLRALSMVLSREHRSGNGKLTHAPAQGKSLPK